MIENEKGDDNLLALAKSPLVENDLILKPEEGDSVGTLLPTDDAMNFHELLILQLPPLVLVDAMNFPYLAQLREVVISMEEAFCFKMPLGVVGTNITYNFTVDKKDFIEFLTKKELDVVYMQLAIL